ncbi:MAG: Uma2 family endonuclease [Syntrophobacteraceae bacterium]|nr:Uma2 family endonuclease [Syntrophobacteraceae bacterium]
MKHLTDGAAMSGIPLKSGYTYEDYRGFPDDLRCEIVDGAIYDMTPASSTKHQRVTGQIYHLIRKHLSPSDACRVYISPTDVILANDQIVQPDVLVVCEGGKVRETGIFGAPDVVFEVLSPATEIKDRGRKLEIYELFGVREYYLVHLDLEFVERYVLSGGAYGRPQIFREEQTFTIDSIGFEIAAGELFAD